MTENQQGPTKEFRAGPMAAAIWREERQEQGRTVIRNTIKIQKRYFDKNSNEWRTTGCLFPNDLPRLCLVAEKAFEYIALRESDEELPADR